MTMAARLIQRRPQHRSHAGGEQQDDDAGSAGSLMASTDRRRRVRRSPLPAPRRVESRRSQSRDAPQPPGGRARLERYCRAFTQGGATAPGDNSGIAVLLNQESTSLEHPSYPLLVAQNAAPSI
jgi:hypothetical protein